MKKIINPCTCKVGKISANAFVKIQYEDERLSISGVVGPMDNGDCRGSCGQCVDEIRNGVPTRGWTRGMLSRLCEVWERWHLNDLRPECEHQRELGWPDMAKEQITLYHYSLTREALKSQLAAEKASNSAFYKRESFTPTEEQALYASLPYYLDVYAPLDGRDIARFYEPKKLRWPGDYGFMENKLRCWVRADEAEMGLLGKPCPICGYKYGTAWNLEKVPQDVLDWLFNLPDTERNPAWV